MGKKIERLDLVLLSLLNCGWQESKLRTECFWGLCQSPTFVRLAPKNTKKVLFLQMEIVGGHPWGKEGAALSFDSSCTVAPKLHSGWLYGAKLHTLWLIMGPRTNPLLSSCALLPFFDGNANLQPRDQEGNSAVWRIYIRVCDQWMTLLRSHLSGNG